MSTYLGTQQKVSLNTNIIDIPFFSFKQAPDDLKNKWFEEIKKTIDLGIFIKGPNVEKFEESWASKINVPYALGVSNGQDGLILALRALNISNGDYVAVPAHTFIAVHNAVLTVGATPYSLDVDVNGLIDLNLLENLNQKISAVIVVHMHGQMVDMQRVMNWANKQDVRVIEDCSQAHLAKQEGVYAGTWGDVGVFSLYPTKNLGALGDAGVMVTKNDTTIEKLRLLSNYGSSPTDKYNHISYGVNYRLDEIQAAILNDNLEYLESWNTRRREIAELYLNNLDTSKFSLLCNDVAKSVWHHFCILTRDRNSVRQNLVTSGIYSEVHYPNVAAIEVEKYLKTSITNYPKSETIAKETISLPLSPWHSNKDIYKVIEKLNSI
jgi:dTDP-4-amino-4,6-dideoxygalactose transaminase